LQETGEHPGIDIGIDPVHPFGSLAQLYDEVARTAAEIDACPPFLPQLEIVHDLLGKRSIDRRQYPADGLRLLGGARQVTKHEYPEEGEASNTKAPMGP
jgi:hypothetical protein